MKIRFAFLLPLFLSALALRAGEIAPEGKKLEKFLDSMRVEHRWLAGVHVDWETGEPDGKPVSGTGRHTHCSAFAAAVCERLGIYLLRPPEHGQVLLANAQFDWLREKGAARGWTRIAKAEDAQEAANHGKLVVAVCKNPDEKKPGHIAIVRPSEKSAEKIKSEGPQVTQAGQVNHNSTTLKDGFKNHREQFENHEIEFYAHAVEKFP